MRKSMHNSMSSREKEMLGKKKYLKGKKGGKNSSDEDFARENKKKKDKEVIISIRDQ